ncbi:MAG TPA: PAS domain-containing sensor histidine kinase, partial [Candidatus Atribacteria bacterium]|nr:PAS domain-containing sensor histidine kinase [Candidatus Atribacteria bacterium]
NSISALNGKGRIEVETMFAKEKELVYIEVRDNGKGIDPEAKHRLLEPYFSTRQKGTGLGLAIVNTIISDHNGKIRFEDNKPKGTKVIIELPIKQEQKNDQ